MSNSSTFPCSVNNFPFDFLGPDGTQVNGTLNEQGQCIFPAAQCALDLAVDGCCKAKPEVAATGSDYMFLAFLVIFVPYFYLRFRGSKARAASRNNQQDKDGANQDNANDDEGRLGTDDKEARRGPGSVPSWVKKLPCVFFVPLFAMGLWVQITMQILIPILMRSSLQSKLDVASRNALIAAEAFLIPYGEIFQFIEDIVLVRVNYALGRGDKELTNQLVHAGIVGSLGTGLIAALIATIIGLIPPALEAVTNPGIENDMELFPGCDLIVNNDNVLPYWMMEVFAIPGTQLGKVMSGFMLGAMELATYGWLGAVSLAMIPLLWFCLVDIVSNKERLLLLSSAEFTAAWMMPSLAILYIISPLGADLRDNTGVNLRFGKLVNSMRALLNYDRNHGTGTPSQKAGAEEHNSDENRHVDFAVQEISSEPKPDSTKTLLIEGLKIMVMDVVIQCCISISIYLALSNSASVAYQLTALQSALPTYGIAYAFGMGIMFKVVGPQLIAAKHFQMFAALARVTCVCSFLLIPLICGAVIPFTSELAFDYGANACAYAKDEECLPFFINIFGPNAQGGEFTLSNTFDVFAAGASVDAIFFILRSMLLSLVDLDFMLKSTAVAVIFYIPAIVVATKVEPFAGEAAPLFIAMYVPQVILIVLFAVRLHILIQRMLQGKPGTWSSSRNLNVSNSVRNMIVVEPSD